MTLVNSRADIKSMSLPELSAFLEGLGEKPFRAKQIFSALHRRQVATFGDMTDLSATLRTKLEETATTTLLTPIKVQTSSDGTVKILYRLEDDNSIETVFMKHRHGNSICISSQVGCAMGCTFCASTKGGRVRNLTAGEMLEQIYCTARTTGEKINSIVVMGIGEPLDNYDNIVRFLELIHHKDGFNMSHRHISLSTCGLCDRIDELADLKLGVTLSISLHSPYDDVRSEIMPINKRFPLQRLMESCKAYFAKTGRRISYEYTLIGSVNDRAEDARALLKLLKGQNAHVNLIMLNTVDDTLSRSSRKSVEMFTDILKKGGLSVTLRRELGGDIDAACGQLRAGGNDRVSSLK